MAPSPPPLIEPSRPRYKDGRACLRLLVVGLQRQPLLSIEQPSKASASLSRKLSRDVRAAR